MDTQRHILVVDDSEDDREMYAQYLSQKGYRVSSAADGTEGLEKAFKLQPDLILMDLWLPRRGGWQTTREIRLDERTKHIPVLVITGHLYPRPELLGCDGWLAKPCPLDKLDAEIVRILQADSQGEEPTARARPARTS